MNSQGTLSSNPRIIVIGAGVSGIVVGARLQKELNTTNFTIYEKADQAGGTWFHNRYPEAKCDVQSHLYSISFEPKLDWTETYSPSGEICDYLFHVAKKHNVVPFIQFGVEMIGADWNVDRQTWTVKLKRLKSAKDGRPGLKIQELEGDVFTDECNFLISGGGGLHFPKVPDFPGMDRFKGTIVHTAAYPEGFSCDGKRVAVIGTGASGVQVVQGVSPMASHLTIYQRTPGWILPKLQYNYSPLQQFMLKLPMMGILYRYFIYLYADLIVFSVMRKGSGTNKRITKTVLHWYKMEVKDPVLREKITPKYALGCKRILPAATYLQDIQRPNVSLETDAIQGIGEEGIITKSQDGTLKETRVDVIIFATGFDIHGFGPMVPIKGKSDTLEHVWNELGGAEAFMNIAQSGFPNLFFTLGPNSATGHMSAMNTIECQVTYILDLIRQCRDLGIKSVDAKVERQREWSTYVQTELDKYVWHSTPGCNSWYRGGKNEGKSSVLLPMSATKYWWKVLSANLKDYEIIKDSSRFITPVTKAWVGVSRWVKDGVMIGAGILGAKVGWTVVQRVLTKLPQERFIQWFVKNPLMLWVAMWWGWESSTIVDKLV